MSQPFRYNEFHQLLSGLCLIDAVYEFILTK